MAKTSERATEEGSLFYDKHAIGVMSTQETKVAVKHKYKYKYINFNIVIRSGNV